MERRIRSTQKFNSALELEFKPESENLHHKIQGEERKEDNTPPQNQIQTHLFQLPRIEIEESQAPKSKFRDDHHFKAAKRLHDPKIERKKEENREEIE